MNSIQALKFKSKYESLPDKYFGFEIFEEIFQAIAKQKQLVHSEFNSGLASADAAVRRLREEYYILINQAINETE